jgi:hypothetical protein
MIVRLVAMPKAGTGHKTQGTQEDSSWCIAVQRLMRHAKSLVLATTCVVAWQQRA